jgi:hypothetical protein
MTLHSWLVANCVVYMAWSTAAALRLWRSTDRSVPFLEFVVGVWSTPIRRTKDGWVFWPAHYGAAKAEYWKGQVSRYWRAVVPLILLQVSMVVIVAALVLPRLSAGSP